ncbi:hypothetical protein, partial [Enterocloster clostridioformis]|uniref:hypothetical protein n=1 Tax=Enterocloster clostridioformis TaxID=1531 RepID=UPI003F5E472B
VIELLCTDYNKKATSIHYYFGNAVLGSCRQMSFHQHQGSCCLVLNTSAGMPADRTPDCIGYGIAVHTGIRVKQSGILSFSIQLRDFS